MNRAIAQFRTRLTSRNSSSLAEAQELYQWLIQPIANDLRQANAETILYAPDAQLRFSGLPFAGVEVNNIAAEIPDTTTLVNQAFSPQATIPRMDDYSVVHLATHAEFVSGLPDESFILFGNGDRVTLREIATWSLPNVDLVVLSACQTAVGGDLGNGEEILGFGYQVQRTGARAAIASLWSVDDGGTQILMNTFYAGLEQGWVKQKH